MEKFSYFRVGEQVHLEATGSTMDLAAEVGHLAHVIYNGLKQHTEADAEFFKQCVFAAIINPSSPVWTPAEQGDGVCIVIPREKN